MTSPMQNKIEQALADLERQKAAVGRLQQDLADAETTIAPKSRAISVTVDGRGELTGVRFPTTAYRTMAPAELGKLITDTIGEAREQARLKAAEIFAEVMPTGVPVLEMLKGPVDYNSVAARIRAAGDETGPGRR